MILALEELEPGASLEADLCVVGAGAAGLAIVSELLSSGLSVVLVESGGEARDAVADALNEGEVIGSFNGLSSGRARGLGGTMQAWPGQCLMLDPADLEQRDWVPHSGWPIRWEELVPYYHRALRFLGLPPDVFERDIFRMFRVEPLPLDRSRLEVLFSVFAPEPNRARVLVPRLRHAADVRAVLRATVVEIVADATGRRVERLELRSPEGRRASVAPRAVALCCGGIENARLLLVSGHRSRGGLANDHDLVGRYFQDHIALPIGTVRTDVPRRLQTAVGVFYRRRLRYHAKLVPSRRLQADARVLCCGAGFAAEPRSDSATAAALRLARSARARRRPEHLLRDVRLAALGAPEVAVGTARRYARGWSPAPRASDTQVLLVAEQAPNRESRITLAESADRLGVARPRVDWRLCEVDRRTLQATGALLEQELRRGGLGELETETDLGEGSGWHEQAFDTFHHIGTTRMAKEPAAGVVDGDCRVHGLSNLFIGGSSVFPTSGFAHPTLTLVALAIRLADRLQDELRR